MDRAPLRFVLILIPRLLSVDIVKLDMNRINAETGRRRDAEEGRVRNLRVMNAFGQLLVVYE